MNRIIHFLKDIYKGKKAVIAVSGGIDSAVSLTLLARAIGSDSITALLLPYGDQSVEDSRLVCEFNNLQNVKVINIEPTVDIICQTLKCEDNIRRGNIMARVRMIVVYDFAKKLNALVCGTENRSEKHLAYFTRFGDEASDVEPILHLYKKQVRKLARQLGIPEKIITKAPSAELWEDQTDESELGFTYEEADTVIEYYLDKNQAKIDKVSKAVFDKVTKRIKENRFKHKVPYTLEEGK